MAAHSSIYDIQGKEETALETQVRLCRNLRQANTEIRQQAGKKISRSFYIFGCFPVWLASKGFCLELEVGYTYPSHPLACLDRKKQTQIKTKGSACTRCHGHHLKQNCFGLRLQQALMLGTRSSWTRQNTPLF